MRGRSDTRTGRDQIRAAYLADEATTVRHLASAANLSIADRTAITAQAVEFVRKIRAETKPGTMARFLAEYGLSTKEGVALMCLAEAMLRVPDTFTIDALISDKITPGDWGRHLAGSSSPLVNASTWALLLTGRVLSEDETEGLAHNVRAIVRRLGEPIVRTAVARAMTELGQQFVLGRTIDEAMDRAVTAESDGYTHSYDMLGEAARTEPDAAHYDAAYEAAIAAIAARASNRPVRDNPGMSVKLSALHPRYEFAKRDTVVDELTGRVGSLARRARDANIGFNIDAEEADRLDLSLDIVDRLLADESLARWNGLGVVVQAYAPRALPVIEWLHGLAGERDRNIMVRLVKGAYWDTEIKRAQVLGLSGFPVFTRKVHTDISYLACARRLLGMQDRIYAQFATHNAHSAAAILHMAPDGTRYEFQRLHGMGEALHNLLVHDHGARSRIYAPVGSHRDLLAYLVRRLLENGANSSFVNQIVDESVQAEEIARDPLRAADGERNIRPNPAIAMPGAIFGNVRRNARGWDLADATTVAALDRARASFRHAQWRAQPLLGTPADRGRVWRDVTNPADTTDIVGQVAEATPEDMETALARAAAAASRWAQTPVKDRAGCLARVADLYEANVAELTALCCREAGKTLPDCVSEVREAVDFCCYYASETRRGEIGPPRGIFICISPWNFPLAIFTGQIAAALVTGNAVIAKPAEQTPLIAARAVEMMHEAGLPRDAIQLLPGDGPTVGGTLVADPRIAGVCFTGSTETARQINRTMADHVAPDAALIAETGGLNAMIVDSTALPEQAVRDVVASAFLSTGQRCSALRILYVQEDVADRTLTMLSGAMDTLTLGDPWHQSTDIGPVIDREAKSALSAHCLTMDAAGRRLKRLDVPDHLAHGCFVPPTVYRVTGIEELGREVFGPILHVATFKAERLGQIIENINAAGYGLTLGIHTRVDRRVQRIIDHARIGNVYVNRNQIGAVVGSQPFGGEGLSGTGPKAGGPFYLSRFTRPAPKAPWPSEEVSDQRQPVGAAELQATINSLDPGEWPVRGDRAAVIDAALSAMARPLGQMSIATAPIDLPGPTGESNRLSVSPRGTVLCLGAPRHANTLALARRQVAVALTLGNAAVVVAPGATGLADALREAGAPIACCDGTMAPDDLVDLRGIGAVAASGNAQSLRPIKQALAKREGPILPLIDDPMDVPRFLLERAVCIDTTAAGGNATLLAAAGDERPQGTTARR